MRRTKIENRLFQRGCLSGRPKNSRFTRQSAENQQTREKPSYDPRIEFGTHRRAGEQFHPLSFNPVPFEKWRLKGEWFDFEEVVRIVIQSIAKK